MVNSTFKFEIQTLPKSKPSKMTDDRMTVGPTKFALALENKYDGNITGRRSWLAKRRLYSAPTTPVKCEVGECKQRAMRAQHTRRSTWAMDVLGIR
jgi:hypothetical protein